MNALCFNQVSFGYRNERPIFENLDINIEKNKVTVLLGANGSGKSTFLKLCVGYLRPHNGNVLVEGSNLSEWTSSQVGHHFSYLPQTPSLPYHLSIRDYILLGRTPYLDRFESPSEKDRDLAENILRELRIDHLSTHTLQEISGGEQQLASFGRILAQDSPIILADEMTSDLDIKNTFKVVQLITRLKKDHTILFSTHDPQLAEAIAENVILFKSKSIVNAGTPDELLTIKNLANLYDIPESHIEKNPIRILWKQ